MSTLECSELQNAVSEIFDMQASFFDRFEAAVVSILPPIERAIVERAIERDADVTNETPFLAAILARAHSARRDVYEASDAHGLIKKAVEDAAADVCRIVDEGRGCSFAEHANVVRLMPR